MTRVDTGSLARVERSSQPPMIGVFMSPSHQFISKDWGCGVPHGSTFPVLIFGFSQGGKAHDLLTLLPFKQGNDEKPACEKEKQSPPLPPRMVDKNKEGIKCFSQVKQCKELGRSCWAISRMKMNMLNHEIPKSLPLCHGQMKHFWGKFQNFGALKSTKAIRAPLGAAAGPGYTMGLSPRLHPGSAGTGAALAEPRAGCCCQGR